MNRFLAASVGLAALIVAGCADGRKDAPLEYQGNVEVRQVSLAFEETGRIAEMRLDEGAQVKAGAVVAVLDASTLTLQAREAAAQADVLRQDLLKLRNGARPEDVAQARARWTAAQAEAAQAEADLARMRDVAARTEGRGVSVQDLDRAAKTATAAHARANEQAQALRLVQRGARAEDIAGAEARIRAAEAQLALLQHHIDRSELRAPTDGVVRSRLMEVGDLATPQTAIYDISLMQPKWVRIYVPETDLGRIREGMDARVTTDSHPDQAVNGQVGYIASTAEFTPKSVQTKDLRTSLVYEVRIVVQDPSNRLRLGQPASVSLSTDGASR